MKKPKVTIVTVIKQCRATTQRVKLQSKPAQFIPILLLRKATGDVIRKRLL
jgi:hypothetical protein